MNKWEKGISYPDITLLPPLARIIQTQGFMAAYETAMEKIKEYPDCHALILTAATMLDGAAMLDPDSPKTRRPYEKDIEALYVRALESTDPSVQNRARSMLIQKFMQRQEYDQAQELIAALPDDTAVDKKQLQANLYIARGQLEDAQSLADISGNCARLFNLWEYNTYIAHFQLALHHPKRPPTLLKDPGHHAQIPDPSMGPDPFPALQTHQNQDCGTGLWRHLEEKYPDRP